MATRRIAGHYEIVREIEEHRCFWVFHARDLRSGRNVSLYVLRPVAGIDEAFRRRYLAAARRLIRVSQPGLATIYEAGEASGEAYVAMELVEGEPLSVLIARDGPLPADRALAIILQVVLAVEALHTLGVVHGNLSSSNIFLDGRGRITLLGYGLPRPPNMPGQPPEQAEGALERPAADIYALGRLASELYGGTSLPATAAKGANGHPGIPPAVAAAIERALAPRPEARPNSAAAFGDLLLASDTSNTATPDESGGLRPSLASSPVPIPMKKKRWRWLILALLLILLALVATAAILYLHDHRSTASHRSSVIAATPLARQAAAAAPLSAPRIVDFAICSDVFACKQNDFAAIHGLAVCFGLSAVSGRDADTLLAVITVQGKPPQNAEDQAIIARSAAIAERPIRSCYIVRLTSPLAAGVYTAWLLDRSGVLAHRDFRTIAPATAGD